MSNILDKKIDRITDKKLAAQAKKLKKVLERAQKENSAEKKKKLNLLKKTVPGSSDYIDLKQEIDDIQTIANGTKITYFDSCLKVLKEMHAAFGIKEWKEITPEDFKKIINKRIDSHQSVSSIRKVISAMNFVNHHAVKTRVFKEAQHINMTNNNENLALLKERGMKRRSSDSKRMKATDKQAKAVIKEMAKYNTHYAQIAMYQLLTGFRIVDAVRQKGENINLDYHVCYKSKGGLTNIVSVNHHTLADKKFMDDLVKYAETSTGRIFERIKDENGCYRSDRSISRGITRLAARCAKKLGIWGKNGETFSSHSFRGAFAYQRMEYYAENHDRLDDLIKQKISEQPRLAKRYKVFQERIRKNVKASRRHTRKIHAYEKIQWLISTDLNHSRGDVVRYYVSINMIKKELNKWIE